MADIFISYSKPERRLTEQLARDLEANGYTVWWDTNLISGDAYQRVIVKELEAARAAIVIWTPSSTQSDWVYSEANRAARDKKLIPVRVPEVDLYDIPPPFDVRQTELVSNRKAIYAALAKLEVRPAGAVPVPAPAEPQRPPPIEQPQPAQPPASPAAPSSAPVPQPAPRSPASPPPYPTASPPEPVLAPRPAPAPPPMRSGPQNAPAPRPTPSLAAARLVAHWSRTRALALWTLLIWAVVALGVHTVVAALNQVRFLGFPLGYYLAAQGSLLLILALLAFFVRRQNRIDKGAAA